MTRDKIIDRVKKLMDLARSSNPNEAALAAQRAQELVERHRIEKEELKEIKAQTGFDVETRTIYTAGKLYWWQHILADGIAQANYCRYMTNGTEMLVVGAHEDILLVGWLYEIFAGEIKRLFDQIYAHDYNRMMLGLPRSKQKARNSFFLGAAGMIVERVKAAREEARRKMKQEATSSQALVCLTDALVRLDAKEQAVVEKINEEANGVRKCQKSSVDGPSYFAGQAMARDIDIDRNRPLGG